MNVRLRPRTTGLFALALLTAVACTALTPHQAEAQVLDRLKQARQQAEGLLQRGVRCTFDDSACVEKAKSQKKPVVLTDKEGTRPDGSGWQADHQSRRSAGGACTGHGRSDLS